MAEQRSIIRLKGTIGNMTFYKTADGYMAKEKTIIEKDRINNSPNFRRTRENMSEFSEAGKTAKVLRLALRELLMDAADKRVVGRLLQAMMKVVQSDLSSPRGMRAASNGNASLLQGFNFNVTSKFETTFFAPVTSAIDRSTGTLTIDIPPYVPSTMIVAPLGATHYKFLSAGAELDFANQLYVSENKISDALPWDSNETAPLQLVNNVTPNSPHPLFLALGIAFFQEVNGQYYPLKNGTFNSLTLIKVENA